jgi:hypothetical protein
MFHVTTLQFGSYLAFWGDQDGQQEVPKPVMAKLNALTAAGTYYLLCEYEAGRLPDKTKFSEQQLDDLRKLDSHTRVGVICLCHGDLSFCVGHLPANAVPCGRGGPLRWHDFRQTGRL